MSAASRGLPALNSAAARALRTASSCTLPRSGAPARDGGRPPSTEATGPSSASLDHQGIQTPNEERGRHVA
ncbi:hypothetical protein GCM10009559_13100 [Pseudonocardia zijingensis]|uniref:Uncharacterized protein n=1 Tax=Pseudonocardia zijingensis TaxID=153376 RepID=A0ABN1PF84_9PSEU